MRSRLRIRTDVRYRPGMAVAAMPGAGRAVVPRRDDEARTRLAAVAAARAPMMLARDRSIAVPGPLGI